MRPSDLRGWQIDAAGVLALAMVSGGVYGALVHPALSERVRAAALSQSLALERARSVSVNKEAEGMEAGVREAERELSRSEIRLQPVTRQNPQLAGLTSLAAASGLRVDTLTPEPAEYTGRFGRVRIRVDGRGSFRQFTDFLASLHETSRDVGVESFSLGNRTEAPGQEPRFTLILTWYVAPPAKS